MEKEKQKVNAGEDFNNANSKHQDSDELQNIGEATTILKVLISKCLQMEKRLRVILESSEI